MPGRHIAGAGEFRMLQMKCTSSASSDQSGPLAAAVISAGFPVYTEAMPPRAVEGLPLRRALRSSSPPAKRLTRSCVRGGGITVSIEAIPQLRQPRHRRRGGIERYGRFPSIVYFSARIFLAAVTGAAAPWIGMFGMMKASRAAWKRAILPASPRASHSAIMMRAFS